MNLPSGPKVFFRLFTNYLRFPFFFRGQPNFKKTPLPRITFYRFFANFTNAFTFFCLHEATQKLTPKRPHNQFPPIRHIYRLPRYPPSKKKPNVYLAHQTLLNKKTKPKIYNILTFFFAVPLLCSR